MKNCLKSSIVGTVKEKFRFGTLNFLFIIAYVNLFQWLFGPENSIVGVIFTIMMSASMVRDLTATPFRHLVCQSAVLIWLVVAAYLVNTLAAPLSLAVNFVTVLLILYAYTYEYSAHIYFPYLLSYLFLVFISPVGAGQLPRRICGMAVGAVSIILYQLFMGRKRVVETARDVLNEMIDDICQMIGFRLGEQSEAPSLSGVRGRLCRLSQTVYERRKRILCVSEASFSMIGAGRGLEQLLVQITQLPEELPEETKSFLENAREQLNAFHAFLHQETDVLPDLQVPETSPFYDALRYIRDRMMHMTDPQSRIHYKKTGLSLKIRLQTALDLSPVRVTYALRTALLLSLATLLVQTMGLPHGKWLLFTLASVSLPYADDVPLKMKKRLLATVIGGLASVVIYALIPSASGRTAAMMLSGYLSFYFTDYVETFACSTVGALGGAVFMSSFGFQAVGSVFLIRLGYIVAGIAIGYVINCVIFPFSRKKATRQLWEKYKRVTGLLSRVCNDKAADSQLYYHLVIQALLLEEKLTQNALLEQWTSFPELLGHYQDLVRQAHRSSLANWGEAAV